MPERARAMAARLADTAARLGVDRDGRDLIARAFEAGMAPRIDAGLDDHHPDFLHTARTALILMDDTGAADPVTIQLKWVTQAQFAGYLVAESKGFYDEENLDITILPGGPNIAPEQVIAGGGADIIVTWMAAALSAPRCICGVGSRQAYPGDMFSRRDPDRTTEPPRHALEEPAEDSCDRSGILMIHLALLSKRPTGCSIW